MNCDRDRTHAQGPRRGPSTSNRHPLGLWRRSTLASSRTAAPRWEIMLDVDALAKAEGEDWVWEGCTSLPPEHRYGLVQLSRGGSDAVVIRELDLTARRFVADGFFLPEAKGGASWLDHGTLLVSSALGGEAYQATVARPPPMRPPSACRNTVRHPPEGACESPPRSVAAPLALHSRASPPQGHGARPPSTWLQRQRCEIPNS
jgi:hypothetical protein